VGLLAIGAQTLFASGLQIVPPKFTKNALLNAFEVYFLGGDPGQSQFVLMIKNGAAFDPADKGGATYLMARMMLEKTARRTGDQIRQDLALMNAEIKFRVGWDAIYFYGSAPQNRIPDVLNVLAEIVTKADFDKDVFETVRQEVVSSLGTGAESLMRLTQNRFRSELFGRNPYAHPVKGTPETLASLTTTDLKIQYRKLVLPNQTQLALRYVGDRAKLFQGMGRHWGSWVKGTAVPFTFRQAKPVVATKVFLYNRPEGEGLVRLGNISVIKGSPDFFDLKVLEQYLTLCMPEWAANVTKDSQIQGAVQLETGKMPGQMQLTIRAPSGQLYSYIETVRRALREIIAGEVDLGRLGESKEILLMDLKAALDDPELKLFTILQANLHEVGLRHLSTFPLRLDRVNPARVSKAAEKYFSPDSFLVVVAGNAAVLAPDLGNLGHVELLN
jgi:zinc protease